ncbi:hypothetical protein [Bacillus sp. SM2101]|uniref:hypothetical protein n=1 Tax=Bacillus sp. SM2101 TaxID=2805366 RepID=UPI001BDEF519|nr:hypothetical protein [Bacillus sp. SM2101]
METYKDDQLVVDLDNITYPEDVTRFLRKKLDTFHITILKRIVKEQQETGRGLIKTRLEDYQSKRKRYDAAFLILESQGFIDRKADGTSTPYFITIRGKDLIKLLRQEKAQI